MKHTNPKTQIYPKHQATMHIFKQSSLALVCSLVCMHLATAQQLSFPSAPPGTGGAEPAPNVIVSVDDSGSMGWDVNGCRTSTSPTTLTSNEPGAVCPAQSTNNNPTRLTSLKNALISQFGDGTDANKGRIADGRIRLAWQAMWNNGGSPGAGTLTPAEVNAMRPFINSPSGTPGGAQHRTNFNTFVTNLASRYGTPSHSIASRVDAYLRTEGTDNPWKNRPGVANSPELSCRRAYHIFMTDGSWNVEDGRTGAPLLAQPPSIGNLDGNTQNLPTPDNSVTGFFTQPIPTQYTPFSANTRIYGDNWSTTVGTVLSHSFNNSTPRTQPRNLGTVSDYAFKSWVQDLQPNIANAVRPLIRKPGNETIVSGTSSTALSEFWNPKNNPATWQHAVTHTIGFGNTAITWPGVPAWDSVTDSTYGGDYNKLVNNIVTWQNPMLANSNCNSNNASLPALCTDNTVRASELWHMALNGRGKFYPARSPEALTAAFSDILNNVLADTSKPLTSIAANTTSLKTGAFAYQSGYAATKWSGSFAARAINPTTAAVLPTETWNAATLLDARDYADRFILSYGTLPTASLPTGFAWSTYDGLPSAQQAPLKKNSAGTVDNNGADRFNFIRGDRSKEETATPNPGIYRSRASKLGDIVSSNVWYVGAPNSGYSANNYNTFKTNNASREPMLYVGANDGMLHGFSATTGVEKFAYIPQGIAEGALRNLADTNYVHRFYVDGSPFTGDFYNGSAWKTALVGTLGAGGKGYFILDATNPINFTSSQAPNMVLADTTASTDADLGHIFSKPVVDTLNGEIKTRQIVRMNNNRWAMVTGNGYNSTNEAPVLVIQYLDGDKSVKKVSPCINKADNTFITDCAFKGANGLSAPQLINLNGDGTVDVAYAGDLKGNVWKFNLSSSSDSNWGVSFETKPFFVARTSSLVTQPITSAPYWTTNKAKGGIMILVGTGRNLTNADRTSTGTDALYALHDDSTFKTTKNATTGVTTLTITDSTAINKTSDTTSPPNSLVQQSYFTTGTVDDSGYTYYRQTANAVDYNGSGGAVPDAKRGWYINWPKAGQRVLTNIERFAGDAIFVQGVIPASEVSATEETCTPQTSNEKGFVAVLNANTGTSPSVPAFSPADAVNSDVSFGNITLRDSDKPSESVSIRKLDQLLTPTTCPAGQTCAPPPPLNTGLYGTLGVRANWRETQ